MPGMDLILIRGLIAEQLSEQERADVEVCASLIRQAVESAGVAGCIALALVGAERANGVRSDR